jgi:hypothetical protein
MLTLRTSASDLDALRYYLANEDADLGTLIAQLRRELPPSAPMLAGTALHKALEIADPGAEFDVMEADGYRFNITADAEIDMPAIREMKETREYLIDGVRITLVGKVDAVHGRRIDDHKFTGRYDPERFMASMQWRVYLEVFGADEFRWNIFEGRPLNDAPDCRDYTIHTIHQLRMHRYPGITNDVKAALRQFLDFARVHLPERLIPWAPGPADYLAAG